MGTAMFSKLSQAGAFAYSLLAVLAPQLAGRAYRDRIDIAELESDQAFQADMDAFRSAHKPPTSDVEAWNRDMDAVGSDLMISFEKERAKHE